MQQRGMKNTRAAFTRVSRTACSNMLCAWVKCEPPKTSAQKRLLWCRKGPRAVHNRCIALDQRNRERDNNTMEMSMSQSKRTQRHIHFVTGKLAQSGLQRIVEETFQKARFSLLHRRYADHRCRADDHEVVETSIWRYPRKPPKFCFLVSLVTHCMNSKR